MNEERVSLRYARAIFDIALEQKNAKQIFDDFVLIDQVVAKSRDFNLLLNNPVIRPDKKNKVIEEIFSGKINELTLKLLLVITEKGREILIPSISRQFEIIYNAEYKRLPIKVLTAHQLNDMQKQDLISKLNQSFKMEILPEYEVDKAVLGGVKFVVADKIIDSSVSNQLEKLKQNMILGN